ncbi:MAG: hypothetical protein JST78_06540 [Bacteroidetes bacterium]|nr:hypothetical protein [Bacteroidota bacterium]
MNRPFLSLALLLLTIAVGAQNKKEIYQFSEDIASNIQKDTLPWKYQLGATEYSMSEYNQKALITWDQNGSGISLLSAQDSLYFSSFQPQDAQAYIAQRSKNEKIILLNEAHHNSRHRVFTTSLLQDLFNNGYRFLGLEALDDPLINIRKFGTLDSGYYTQEPQLANLIHEAMRIGFTLFGYEASAGAGGKQRETEQAQNIARMIHEHPEARFLIHCGWDHVIEGTPGNKTWEKAMAGRLKELTQIDPFTIDQTAYSEKGDPKFNSPYIAMTRAQKPMIMVDATGKTFNGNPTNDQTDCRIIHPITQYRNNRPDWLYLNGKRKAYRVAPSKIAAYPVLVLAYRKDEYKHNAVPADVIEIINAQDPTELVLDPGRYKIILKNKAYTIIDAFDVKIK